MAEGSGPGPRRHSRVNWVALRTLRQLPKVVGENTAGEPIVEVRSVRLVLREGASHFSRVTTCSKCGREVPGAPVLSPADLDYPPHPVICTDCVRNAAAPVLSTVGAAETAPDPAAGDGGRARPDDDRVAVLERRIAELAELVTSQQAVLEGRVDDTRVELRSFAAKELARAQEDVDRMMKGVVERVGRAAAGTDAGGAQAVEAKLSRSLERLSQRVDDQRAELVADLDARVAQLQATIEDQAGPPASQVEELRVTVEALAATLETRGDNGNRVEALEARLAQLQDRIDAAAAPERERLESIAAQVRDLEERFAAGPAGAEQHDSGLEERVASDRRRREMLEAQLRELPPSIQAETTRIEAQLTERLDRVAAQSASDHLESRLEDLERAFRAEPAPDRVDALEAQLRALEDALAAGAARTAGETASELARLDSLQAQQQELREGFDAVSRQLAERASSERRRLDALEAELRNTQAEVEEEVARIARAGERSAIDRQRLDALEARPAAEAARIEAEVHERLEVLDTVVAATEHLDERLDRVAEEARHAAAGAVDQRVRPLEQSLDDLGERLDRQAERERRARADVGRLEALEERVEDAVERLAALVESQRLEFQEEVRTGLAEARMAMAADQRGGGRLKKLEEAAAQQDARLAELMELQTALDTGLGQLRSDLEEVRETASRPVHTESRLHATAEIPALVVPEPETGRRGGRKAGEALAGLTAAVQGLLNDNRAIRAELATIANESETAVRASARASAQAGAIAPLRQNVRDLRDEVVVQNRAAAALAKRVETLRKTLDAPAKAAKPATKAVKATKAAKAAKPAKATRTTKKA